MKLLEEAVPLVEGTEELARKSFEAGQLSLAEWLVVRREAVETRLDYLEQALRGGRGRHRPGPPGGGVAVSGAARGGAALAGAGRAGCWPGGACRKQPDEAKRPNATATTRTRDARDARRRRARPGGRGDAGGAAHRPGHGPRSAGDAPQVVEGRPGGEGVTLLGELQVNQDAYAEVGTPVEGRVARLAAAPGDLVKAGAPLVEIDSVDAGARPGRPRSAPEARAELARQAVERKRRLVADNVAPGRELDEAEADGKAAEAELRAARTHAAGVRAPAAGGAAGRPLRPARAHRRHGAGAERGAAARTSIPSAAVPHRRSEGAVADRAGVRAGRLAR